MRNPPGQRFSDGLKKLYFDTVLYTESAMGSSIDPDTGHPAIAR